jgi:hypothetical protein
VPTVFVTVAVVVEIALEVEVEVEVEVVESVVEAEEPTVPEPPVELTLEFEVVEPEELLVAMLAITPEPPEVTEVEVFAPVELAAKEVAMDVEVEVEFSAGPEQLSIHNANSQPLRFLRMVCSA